ncbi:ABHD17C-like protein isoform X1 [Tanacetum coccineum]
MGAMTSSVAAKFAFYPPSPPSYKVVVTDDDGGKKKMRLSDVNERENVDVLKVKTKKGTEIVLMFVKDPVAKMTVLYSHGNAADLGQMYELFCQLSVHLKVNLMGYDYSGYGQSSGKPSEQNTYADIEAAYRCLEETYGVKEEDVILYGQSVGSGPTLELASRLSRLRAVILHSPIMSGLRVMYPVKHTFWFDIYKNIDKIPLVRCPVLVIHGTADDVVDYSHGKQLYEHCVDKYEPLWIEGGNHCDLEIYPEYIRHLKKFISAVEKSDRLKNLSGSTDTTPRSSTNSTDKSRPSMDQPRPSTSTERSRSSLDKREKSKKNMENVEKSRNSTDQPEKARNSIDRLAAALCNIDCFKPTGATGVTETN